MGRRKFYRDEENPYDYVAESSTPTEYRNEEKPAEISVSRPAEAGVAPANNTRVSGGQVPSMARLSDISKNLGNITAGTMKIPDSANPLFSVDNEGNVTANSLKRNDFHWFTVFESIDGYTQSIIGAGSITSQNDLTLTTGAAINNDCELQKILSSAASEFSWNKKRRIKMDVQFVNNTSQTIYLTTGSNSAGIGTSRHFGFYVSDGYLYGTCADGTTQSTIQLTAVATGNNHDLEALLIPGDKIYFYYDENLLGSISTNMPTGVTTANWLLNYYIKTSVNAAKEVRIAYYDFWQAN